MEKDIYFESDLNRELGQTKNVLEKWRKLGLIQADGTTSEGTPFYTRNTFKRILHVKQLVELGYNLEDVQKIIRKIGIPSENSSSKSKGSSKLTQYLTVGGLAEKVGVTRQTILAVEKNKYLPSLLLAVKIARIFDKKVEDVFEI